MFSCVILQALELNGFPFGLALSSTVHEVSEASVSLIIFLLLWLVNDSEVGILFMVMNLLRYVPHVRLQLVIITKI